MFACRLPVVFHPDWASLSTVYKDIDFSYHNRLFHRLLII